MAVGSSGGTRKRLYGSVRVSCCNSDGGDGADRGGGDRRQHKGAAGRPQSVRARHRRTAPRVPRRTGGGSRSLREGALWCRRALMTSRTRLARVLSSGVPARSQHGVGTGDESPRCRGGSVAVEPSPLGAACSAARFPQRRCRDLPLPGSPLMGGRGILWARSPSPLRGVGFASRPGPARRSSVPRCRGAPWDCRCQLLVDLNNKRLTKTSSDGNNQGGLKFQP